MLTPTAFLRLAQDPRSDAAPPVLQQWFATIHNGDIFFDRISRDPSIDADGEWRNVPIVTACP